MKVDAELINRLKRSFNLSTTMAVQIVDVVSEWWTSPITLNEVRPQLDDDDSGEGGVTLSVLSLPNAGNENPEKGEVNDHS